MDEKASVVPGREGAILDSDQLCLRNLQGLGAVVPACICCATLRAASRARCHSDPALRCRGALVVHTLPLLGPGRKILQSARVWTTLMMARLRGRTGMPSGRVHVCQAYRDPLENFHYSLP